MNCITFKVLLKSNLLIGGNPQTFEIGGVDQCTALDNRGYPIIPASSFKGAFRDILVNEGESYKHKDEICNIYKAPPYCINDVSLIALLGISGRNNTPKLLFSDLILSPEDENKQMFSIDMKNSITQHEKDNLSHKNLVSLPRTYKVAIQGLSFIGKIDLWLFKKEDDRNNVIKCVKKMLEKFNEGIYRLGNSKSRGYGKIAISNIETVV